MKKLLGVIALVLLNGILFSQEVTAVHKVTPTGTPNEYNINTVVTGLEGADIARITYFIPKDHTYKPSSKNSLFSNREDEFIRFYVMAIPSSGVLTVDLGLLVKTDGNFNFPVEFQYSKNEEKVVLKFENIKIENSSDLVAEETTTEEVEPEQEPAPVIEEIPEPVAPIAEEESTPVVEEIPEPVEAVEEEPAPAVEETPEPAVEVMEEESTTVAEEEAPEPTPTMVEEDPIPSTERVEEPEPKEEPAPIIEETPEPTTPITEEEPTLVAATPSSQKFGVQIFALSQYSEQKVANFCKKNGLSLSKITTEEVGGFTKVRYGNVSSRAEAEALRKELLAKPLINGAFVVLLKN